MFKATPAILFKFITLLVLSCFPVEDLSIW